MEDYTMKNPKQKPYEDGRSQTEMEPTLVELVGSLERQANIISDMAVFMNESICDSDNKLQKEPYLIVEQRMPIMVRLKGVVEMNYATAMNMERLINKINGGTQNGG